MVIRWALTQTLHITDQLQHGVRYFDMRSGYLTSEDDFFFVHGVYGHKIGDILQAISTFLKAHPKEFIILDFNHFYSFSDTLHRRLAKLIISYFNNELYSPIGKGINSTLSDLRKVNKQVIVCYDDETTCQENQEFWYKYISSPWPNTSSCSKLISSLNQRFDTLNPKCFNVFQAILTPQTSTVLLHLASSLQKYLVSKCDKAVSNWLTDINKTKKHGINIVICDFVSMDGCSSDVVKLNDLFKTKEK